MAAPTYNTDIVVLDGTVYTNAGTLTLADYDATGGGQAGLNLETDFYLIGSNCISKNAFGNGAQDKGIVDDTNSGGNISTTLASGNNPNGNQYVYVWGFWNAPASLEVAEPGTGNGGLYMIVGASTNAYDTYHVTGSDLIDYGADWICATIDPTEETADNTVGGGSGGNFTVFGIGANIPVQGPTKGSPLAIEAVRRGSNLNIIDGEVASPATFTGLEAFDGGNTTNGRLGVFTERRGVYVLNTEVKIGTTASLCYFNDTSGATIVRQIDANKGLSSTEQEGGKHKFTIENASSTVIWENVTILNDAIDIDIVDNATVNFTSCSFFGVRLLQCGGSNTTLTRCTLPQDSVVIANNTMGGTNTTAKTIQNGATITACTIQGTSTTTDTSGVEVSGTFGADMSLITDCNFVGNGRALIIPGTITGTTNEVTYDGHSYGSGYTTGSTGTFSGPSGTSNAVIQCNVDTGAQLKVIVQNLPAGESPPSIYNTGNGTVVVEQAIAVTISGILGNSEVSVLTNPSPYTQNGATPNSLFNQDVVAAVTGTDIELDTGGGANVTQIISTTTDFTTIGLLNGDEIRVTQRNNLEVFDVFTVLSVSANAIDVTDVATSTIRQTDLIDSPGETVTVEKIDASYTFSVPGGTAIDVLVYRVGSLPVYILDKTITADNASFPISQTLDRNYSSFEV